ncbi:MAG TPA: TonB family protein [Sphingobium sp.]
MAFVQAERSGYRSSSSLSPASLAGVVIVHLGLGAAVLSMTAITIFREPPTILLGKNIPATAPRADPVKAEPVKPAVKTPVTTTTPVIILPKQPDTSDFARPDPVPIPGTLGGTGSFIDPVKPTETPPPIMIDAKPDARFAGVFQPAYPAAMLRLQVEGNVTVRITIGPDGRVLDVALVSAVDPAFFEATKRQALSRWRFTPATRDGVPVVTEKVMTVRFRLTD